MKNSKRFQDLNLTVSDFYHEVWIVCPSCAQKAITKADYENKLARLFCENCGYNKQVSTEFGTTGTLRMEASAYFDASFWLQTRFKNEIFFAYNLEHLEYFESYIAAGLKENSNRTHFTMLEKLPKFIQVAKNREALLKLILKLKNK